jgi:prepilin-type N-terminal cleavage/methylation domain-containing protein/prepilin-type processing-associated H-X9-DG protein
MATSRPRRRVSVASHHRAARAYTLAEVVVAIAIVAILMALALSAVQKVRVRAGQVACQNNLRQIGLAMHSMHATHDRLPPYPVKGEPELPGFRFSFQGISWHVFALPYIEQTALWDQTVAAYAATSSPWSGEHRTLMSRVIRVYGCPMDPRTATAHTDSDGFTAAYTSYLGITGSYSGRRDGCFAGRPGISFAEITDGVSNTAMIGEGPPSAQLDAGWWYATHPSPKGWVDYELPAESALDPYYPECPGFIITTDYGFLVKYFFAPGSLTDNCSRFYFWSLHPGGSNFLFADGAVRFLPYTSRALLPALASRAGGEAVQLPD